MQFFRSQSKLFQRLALLLLTAILVVGGSLWQGRVLGVNAAVQVLLVSDTAIPFGQVFPGEELAHTYTVQLDTSANSASYVTTLTPLPNVLNLCPFLQLISIDSPAEPDTLANATLARPGDVLDKWQVQLEVPGIEGQLSQDNKGGIIVTGGNYGCKITITTTNDPGKIIICKKSLDGTGDFNYTGDLGKFDINTSSSSKSSNQQWGDNKNTNNNDCGQQGGSQKGGKDNYSNSNSKDSYSYNDNDSQNNGSNGGIGEKVFSNIDLGTYNISETSQDGWDLTSLTCKDPSNNTTVSGNSAGIVLGSNETVVCTFVNTKKKGSIIIQKKTIGGDGKFSFDGDLGHFNLQTTNNSASQTFSNLKGGSYKVTEDTVDGWSLTSLVCTDPSGNSTVYKNTANINLGLGETVTCTFTNTKKQGTIIIQKKALGGDGKFSFSGDLGSFNIQTASGQGSQTFANLNAGNYKISENATSTWKLYSIVCTGSGYNSTAFLTSANINLKAGQTVTCTFTNKKKSIIIIHKKTGGDNDSCNFSGDLGNFNIPTSKGSGDKTFNNLDSGSYTITESADKNWSPSLVVCTNQNGVIVNKNSAKINLGDGQVVDCTFTNISKK